MKLEIFSDFPSNSGLGGSSAISAVILGCFNEFRDDPWDTYELSELAFQAERLTLNIAGGWQDQYACTFGGFNFIEFTKEYTDFDGTDETLFATFFIDWNLVAKDYDGIEVFPFPKKDMPEAKWLKSWDVSSGCVWNTNKVKLKFVG